MKTRPILVLVVAISCFDSAPLLAQKSIHDRKAEVLAVLANSPKLYDGRYVKSGVASVCGEIPKEASLTGTATFVVHFDSDAAGPVVSVAFGSQQLTGGVTETALFNLNLSVVTATGGRPPAYVLNTDTNKRVAGTARLAIDKDGVITLKVTGSDELKRTIDLTVVCR